MPSLRASFVLALCLIASRLDAEPSLSQRIDTLVRAKGSDYGAIASPLADDGEFLRRVYLDLNGINPTAEEARAFLKDADPKKREALVDRLLESPLYARHMQNVFDLLWMDRRPAKHVKMPEWQEFLRKAFAANKPYDQLVSELLTNDGSDPKTRPAARFFLDREGEPHQITRDVGRLFLGMNLQCAQCHDHPIADPFLQAHYYGIYAFFNRSYLFNDKKAKMSVYAEKAEGDVSYESVFVAKVKKTSGPRLPEGKLVPEPKLAKGKEYVAPPNKGERGVPTFSRRSQLAKLLVDSPRFPRATMNRLWSHYLGRGIVHPVEFDHDDNPPSHPELLNMLSAELAGHKYDLKHVIRGILLSETYQRSSLLPKSGTPAAPERFAIATLRPLSAEQFAWSLLQATGMIDAEKKALGAKATPAAVYAKLAGHQVTFVKLFGGDPGEPSDPNAFESTLDQTLFLNNGDLLRSWLAPRPASLTFRLAALKDADAIAEELYLSVLSRSPTKEERRETSEFLGSRTDRTVAIQDLAWALLASAEFRFNH